MSVTFVCGSVYSDNELLVITCGADSILAIWKVTLNSNDSSGKTLFFREILILTMFF